MKTLNNRAVTEEARDVRFSGAGVTGNYEPLDVSARNQVQQGVLLSNLSTPGLDLKPHPPQEVFFHT